MLIEIMEQIKEITIQDIIDIPLEQLIDEYKTCLQSYWLNWNSGTTRENLIKFRVTLAHCQAMITVLDFKSQFICSTLEVIQYRDVKTEIVLYVREVKAFYARNRISTPTQQRIVQDIYEYADLYNQTGGCLEL
jgi:hypothetical protein